jgi:hypothetical protein
VDPRASLASADDDAVKNAAGVALCCLWLLPAAGRAQELGVHAGLNAARGEAGADWRAGFIGGVCVMPPGADRGGWEFELLVHQKGPRTYLEVPLLLHMDVVKISGRRAVYAAVGPAPAVGVHSSDTKARTFDLGLVVAAGLELRPFVLDARYTHGVRGVFESEDSRATFKNRSFAITAGFRWPR